MVGKIPPTCLAKSRDFPDFPGSDAPDLEPRAVLRCTELHGALAMDLPAMGGYSYSWMVYHLVGGFKKTYFPFHIWDNPNPIDELIFFKMVIAPPTSHGKSSKKWMS